MAAYNPLDKLLQQFQTAQQQIQAANLAREREIRAITDEIIARYQPGGAFQKAALGQLATQKVSDVGAGMQRLIASGMAGTEAAGGLETGWEQAVGAPSRLKLEDLMMERLSQAQMGKAGFIERIEQPYPDYSMVAQLAGQAAAGPSYAGDPYAAQREQQIREAQATRQSQKEFSERWGSSMPTGGATPSPTSEPWSPAVPQGGRYPTTTTQPIQMAAGYGPAFQAGGGYAAQAKQMAEKALPSTIYGTPTRGITGAMPALTGKPSAEDYYAKLRGAKTYEEFSALAGGAKRAGTKREWEAARRYY